jgi:hypothetical protein
LLYSFPANRTFRERFCIVKPGLFVPQFPRRAALQIGNKHGILASLPFQVRVRRQPALKFLQFPSRVREFPIARRRFLRDEYAVKTSFPRIAVNFSRNILATSRAVRRESMVRRSPISMNLLHPRTALTAYASPASGERISNDPK